MIDDAAIVTLIQRRPALAPVALRPAERELLTWLSHGKHHQEIADITAVSVQTIRVRVSRLMDKLGAATSAGAVAIALRKGLIK